MKTTKIMTTYEQSKAVHIPTHVEKTRLTRRGKAAVALGGIGMVLAAAKGLNTLHDNQTVYTHEQLVNMPQEAVIAQPGEGAIQILRRVEPGVLSDPEKTHELIDYITQEGLNHSDSNHPQLEVSQQVLVPLVPGVEHLQQK